MRSQTLFEAFSYIDDRYLDIAESPVRESSDAKQNSGRSTVRKTVSLLLAAAICVSLLAVTAVAAGWLPGLFNTLKEAYPYDEELFEAAAQANTDAVPEVLEIPYLDLSKLVILERYFDGETILVGYDLDAVLPAFCFEIRDILGRQGIRWVPAAWGFLQFPDITVRDEHETEIGFN